MVNEIEISRIDISSIYRFENGCCKYVRVVEGVFLFGVLSLFVGMTKILTFDSFFLSVLQFVFNF